MRIVNDGLPTAMFWAISRRFATDDHEYIRKDPTRISVTEAIGSARESVLRRKHEDDIVVNASSLVWALDGVLCHKLMEDYGQATGDAHELHLEMDIEGLTLTGRVDVIQSSGTMTDLKRTKTQTFADGPREKDVAQINGYAMLAHHNRDRIKAEHGIDVDALKLEILAWHPDWSPMTLGKKGPPYPQAAIYGIPVTKWDYGRTLRYFASRVRRHREAREGKLPLCTEEERMCKKSHWGVVPKSGGKSVRNKDTKEEAEEHRLSMANPENYELEYRIGEPHNCMYYCSVRAFCEQWAAERLKGRQALVR